MAVLVSRERFGARLDISFEMKDMLQACNMFISKRVAKKWS